MTCTGMSKLLALALLLAAVLASQAAIAAPGRSHTSLHIDDSALRWDSDGRELGLRDGSNGVAVTSARPEPQLGLRRGDTIESVDGRPTRTLQGLLSALKRRQGREVSLDVRDDAGRARMVHLAAADYDAWLPPEPPTPPTPPSPPGR